VGFEVNKYLSFDERVGSSNNGFWWLRSPGDSQDRAADVANHGKNMYSRGSYVNDETGYVRPALWLNLESAIALRQEEIERQAEKERKQIADWKAAKRCQHCGGDLKGAFTTARN